MSTLSAASVSLRRLLARRPWLYWFLVSVVAVAVAATVLERVERVDAARDSWGATVSVMVADGDHAPGDRLRTVRRDVPRALIASGTATEPAARSLVARQRIGDGEIVHGVDVVAVDGPQSLTPPGWLAVPIVESPASGAEIGDRVLIAADGIVISADALVVSRHEPATLIAVPADEAPLVAAASDAGAVTLLLEP